MVSFSDIKLNNTSLLTPGTGPVCAFVGATGGIGLSTVQAVLKHTSTPTIYLVGRNASRLSTLISSLKSLNGSATIIPIVAEDLTLVGDAEKAAQEIASKTNKLDLLIMSPGYLSFSRTPDFSPEGIDRLLSIRYHARIRFLLTLLPLLRAAPNPRVVSILAGGMEVALNLDDLGWTQKGTYGPIYAAGATAAMTTVMFEELGKDPKNEKIVFLHVYPGLVYTGLSLENTGWILPLIWDYILKPIFWLIAMTSEEAGERVLFAATSGRFRKVKDPESVRGTLIEEGSDGVLGSGVYAVKGDSSAVTGGGNKDLRKMREMGAGRKVFDYTMAELERIEKM